jgi:AcrR family transcriptional regulator
MALRKDDRRVQRTKQLLREALLCLIREKGFEALTVQDIIDRANVGRATFYAHFDNKEDLLVSGLEGLRVTLKEHQRQAHLRQIGSDEQLFAFSRETFAHVAGHRDVFRAMVGKQSGALIQQLLHKIMVDLVREDVKAMLGRTGPVPAEAVVQFLAGGLFGLVRLWADGKLRLSVDEVNALFRKLALPAVRAVTR